MNNTRMNSRAHERTLSRVRTSRRVVRAAAALMLSGFVVVGASCLRSDPPAVPGTATTTTTTAPVRAAGIDCIAASKDQPYKFEAGNYWEHQLKVIKDQHDMQVCARACADNPDCKVATFTDATVGNGWGNSCVLRNGVGARHPEESGICSWVKPAKKP